MKAYLFAIMAGGASLTGCLDDTDFAPPLVSSVNSSQLHLHARSQNLTVQENCFDAQLEYFLSGKGEWKKGGGSSESPKDSLFIIKATGTAFLNSSDAGNADLKLIYHPQKLLLTIDVRSKCKEADLETLLAIQVACDTPLSFPTGTCSDEATPPGGFTSRVLFDSGEYVLLPGSMFSYCIRSNEEGVIEFKAILNGTYCLDDSEYDQ